MTEYAALPGNGVEWRERSASPQSYQRPQRRDYLCLLCFLCGAKYSVSAMASVNCCGCRSANMRNAFVIGLVTVTVSAAPARSPDIPFKATLIDNGASETAAVADVNHDGKLDIISGENWYEAPAWTKHKFRELNFTNNYYDNFSDLPVDVNGDGY